jgi:hypothetical protein
MLPTNQPSTKYKPSNLQNFNQTIREHHAVKRRGYKQLPLKRESKKNTNHIDSKLNKYLTFVVIIQIIEINFR